MVRLANKTRLRPPHTQTRVSSPLSPLFSVRTIADPDSADEGIYTETRTLIWGDRERRIYTTETQETHTVNTRTGNEPPRYTTHDHHETTEHVS